MLKFLFKFLRPHYFLTLSLIWFDENFAHCSHHRPPPPPLPTPPPPPPHTHTHTHTHTPRSSQNQGHGLRIFQKQNVQYQASYPVWRQVLLSSIVYLCLVSTLISTLSVNKSHYLYLWVNIYIFTIVSKY